MAWAEPHGGSEAGGRGSKRKREAGAGGTGRLSENLERRGTQEAVGREEWHDYGCQTWRQSWDSKTGKRWRG